MKPSILEAIQLHIETRPNQPALVDPNQILTYAELWASVQQVARSLEAIRPSAIALMAENSIAWVILDLAAMQAEIPLVPIPTFFTAEQAQHVLRDAKVDLLVVDYLPRLEAVIGKQPEHFSMELGAGLKLIGSATGHHGAVHDPKLAKVTYTSGSTGAPKGVCLSADNLAAVCHALKSRTACSAQDRHACVLPLSTLLENVAGVYLPLMTGATVYIWPDQARGLMGATRIDGTVLLDFLKWVKASTAIFTPGLLHHLLDAMDRQHQSLPKMRFLAVGGAAVSSALLKRASAFHLPVYEGYGLSECASVVSLNAPDSPQQGCGRPLSHVQVEIAEDGEICVRGNLCMGYLNHEPNAPDALWPTGDIGSLDDEGHLHITGRKKNLIVTDRGRNVSPEWVEQTLLEQAVIGQVAVFGDAQPFLVAVITTSPEISDEQVDLAILAANQTLPDYAQVGGWVRSSAPMGLQNGQINPKGDLVRRVIEGEYAQAIEMIYSKQEPRYGIL